MATDNLTTDNPRSPRAAAYIIGLILALIVCVIVGYSELVASRGGSGDAILLGASHMPPAAIGALMAILLISALLKWIHPVLGLRPAELAVIYVMTVCGALLSSFGLAAQLLPNLAGVNYYADPSNEWRTMLLSRLPAWLVPFDPQGPEKQFVTRAYYEGLREGQHIPWGDWLVPLAAWSALALLMFFLMACLATLLRRQWVDNEKLSFPLVQLPLEMMEGGVSTRPASERKLLWIGALIPFLFHGMNGLHNMAPNVPQFRSWFILNEYFVAKPWTDIQGIPIAITFSVIGFAYLLPLDVSFSMWFFLLFFRFQDLIGSYLGYQFDGMPLYPASFYVGYQAVGAAVAVCLSLVWLAKPHLKLVWERVSLGKHKGLDANEMMSYRTAFVGAIVSLMLVIAWCWLAGMNVLVAAFMMICFIFLVVAVMSRCVAEVGLLMLQGLFRPIDVWAVGATRISLGAGNLAPMALMHGAFMRDPRTLMPVFMDGLKLSDGVKLPRRSLAIGLALAIPVTMIAAYVIHLLIAYNRGGVTLNTWFFGANPTLYMGEARGILLGPKTFDVRAPAFFSVGLLFTFFLYFMRARFWWWPFHPLGYAIGASWPAMVYWVAFFMGWLCKNLLLRYGGIRAFRMFRPLFLGLIFGEFASAILWAAITALAGSLAPMIPLT
ncbi:MAG: hypothetical protein Q7T82_08370 [Armatimonadota bacterium]|nr:hypothetical protein [Armatimonadota bacterium]